MGIFTKKTVGLEIGQRTLRAAGLRKSGGRHAIDWLAEAALPDGLVTSSFTEPNISDSGAFSEAVGRLLRTSGFKNGGIKVALPDYLFRVSMIEFDTLPGKADETDRMLKWKLKKMLPFDIEQARLRHQYLGRFRTGEKETHRFLVSVIKSDVLVQYEQAFSAAGLKPEWIETSTYAVWNLFEEHIMKEAGGDAGFALMNLTGGKLAVMVFSQGVPHFLRLKDLWAPDAEEEGDRVLRELNASLTFYKENYSGTEVRRVYMAGDAACLRELPSQLPHEAPFKAVPLDVYAVIGREGAGGRKAEDALCFAAACGAASEV